MPAAPTQGSLIAQVVAQQLSVSDTVTVTLYGRHKMVASIMGAEVFISLEGELGGIEARELAAQAIRFDKFKVEFDPSDPDLPSIAALLLPLRQVEEGVESMADLVALGFIDFRIQAA